MHHGVGRGENASELLPVTDLPHQLDIAGRGRRPGNTFIGEAVADLQHGKAFVAQGPDRVEYHRPLFLRMVPANTHQQLAGWPKAEICQQLPPQPIVTPLRVKQLGINPKRHEVRSDIPVPEDAVAKPARANNHAVEAARGAGHVAPARPCQPVHAIGGHPALQPHLRVRCDRVGMHEQGLVRPARGMPLPIGNNPRTAEGRRRLHHIGFQRVQQRMHRRCLPEDVIARIDRYRGGFHIDDLAAFPGLDPVFRPRRNHRHFHAMLMRKGQLGIDIGFHPSAQRGIEFGNVNDMHACYRRSAVRSSSFGIGRIASPRR